MNKLGLFLLVLLGVLTVSAAQNVKFQPSIATSQPTQAIHLQTASTGNCHATARADRHCTPGATYPGVTKADVCTPGWAGAHRDVSYSLKQQVYANYGISHHQPGEYEIDHLIPLEAGGGNQITNLWPEKQPGASYKDTAEDNVHRAICSGKWTLRHAWFVIRSYYIQR